jgi:hypothetical protein
MSKGGAAKNEFEIERGRGLKIKSPILDRLDRERAS